MIIYRFFSTLIFIILLPYLFFHFERKERKQRFGKIKIGFKKSIWIHAASVGEVNAVKSIIMELLSKYPKREFILSTMTSTGQKVAKKISPKLTSFFFPLDVGITMRRLFKRINPELIILVETEFWPNMLHIAREKNIPVIIINGRISDRSYRGYRISRFFWKPLWRSVICVNAQSEKDAGKFLKLKFNNVENTHNLKFNIKYPDYEKEKLRKELGYSEDDFILIWGSSRPGEEKLLRSIFSDIDEEISNLKVIIAPRHLHRLSEIREIFKGYDYRLYSELKIPGKFLIVDEMGILDLFYALSDISIVGGSFYDFGGHNPLEPAYYGVPIIMGKYYHSCHDSVDRLKENNGIIISDRKKLQKNILKIAKNKKLADQLGKNAKRTLKLNADSMKKNLAILEKYIK
ncbi:MAG: 3-deoxy-D-manno-octulosonic acid transferase [Candidatus Cloacimonetes bacterium]|nr:3-deoxy-D-manno-octulosonic acid transferase [Candidatus Cloacimonadota bacterium]